MKKSRYTEEQIAFALRQAEGGTTVRVFWGEVAGGGRCHLPHEMQVPPA